MEKLKEAYRILLFVLIFSILAIVIIFNTRRKTMLCKKCKRPKGLVHTCPTPDLYVGNWILWVIVALVLGAGILGASTASSQETRVSQGIVCLNFDDAKAIVDLEINKSLADAKALASSLLRRDRCKVLRISIPVYGSTKDMEYHRKKDGVTLGVMIVPSPNGTPLYVVIHAVSEGHQI